MRPALMALILLLAPGLALAGPRLTACQRPASCATLASTAAQCKKGKNCGRLTQLIDRMTSTNSCRYDSRQSDWQRCDKTQSYPAFDALAHLKTPAARKLFCSDAFHKSIGRDSALSEDYDYAYVRLKPDDMAELTPAEIAYYQTMIDCGASHGARH